MKKNPGDTPSVTLIEMKFTVLDGFLPKLPLKLNFNSFNNLYCYIDEFIFCCSI